MKLYLTHTVKGFEKKPETRREKDRFTGFNAQNWCLDEYVTLDQFAELVKTGHAWTVGSYNGYDGGRKKENVQDVCLLALDFDERPLDEKDKVLKLFASANCLPCLTYDSYSNLTERKGYKACYRLVWVLDTVLDGDEFETLVSGLLAYLKEQGFEADSSCKDRNRLFFGTWADDTHTVTVLHDEKTSPARFNNFCALGTGKDVKNAGRWKKNRACYGELVKETVLELENCDFEKARLALSQNCSLWRKFENGVLEYNDELALFCSLKGLKGKKQSVFDALVKPVYEKNADKYKHGTDEKKERFDRFFNDGRLEPVQLVKGLTVTEFLQSWFSKGSQVQNTEQRQSLEQAQDELNKELESALTSESDKVQVLQCETGLGKTTALANWLKDNVLFNRYNDKLFVFACSTHENCRELLDKFEAYEKPFYWPESNEQTESEQKTQAKFGFYVTGTKKEHRLEETEDDKKRREFKQALTADFGNGEPGAYVCTHELVLRHADWFDKKNTVLIFDETPADELVKLDTCFVSSLQALERFFKYTGDFDSFVKTVKNAETGFVTFDFKYADAFAFENFNWRDATDDAGAPAVNLALLSENLKNTGKVLVRKTEKDTELILQHSNSLSKAKVLVLSATPKTETLTACFKYATGRDLEVHTVKPAERKGTVTQYLCDWTGSKLNGSNLVKAVQTVEKRLSEQGLEKGKTNVLTFKDWTDTFETQGFKVPVNPVKKKDKTCKAYFFNEQGLDYMKGEDLAVTGKPDKSLSFYRRLVLTVLFDKYLSTGLTAEQVFAFADNLTQGQHKETVENVPCTWHCFDDELLRTVQRETVQAELTQCVGRARVLRYPCKVLVFANVPLACADTWCF